MKRWIIVIVLTGAIIACNESTTKENKPVGEVIADDRKPANEKEAAIYKSADSMMTAFKKRDWKAFALFTHPAMVRVMGGAESMAFMVQQQMQDVPDSVIKSATVDKVLQVEKVDDELQCVVQQTIVMEMNGSRIISNSYLIGESLNQGKSWTFFDASNTGKIRPIDIKPNLSPGLKIPAKKQQTEAI